MKKIMKNEKGFTLIELIIVIAILAIIAAVAIPNILNAVDNSRKSADVANAKIILNAAAQVSAKNSSLTLPTTDLEITNTALALTGTVDTFAEALLVELNNSAPLPKYKKAGDGTTAITNFILTVGTNGTMTIAVGAGTTEADNAGAVVYVAPTPSADYDQK